MAESRDNEIIITLAYIYNDKAVLDSEPSCSDSEHVSEIIKDKNKNNTEPNSIASDLDKNLTTAFNTGVLSDTSTLPTLTTQQSAQDIVSTTKVDIIASSEKIIKPWDSNDDQETTLSQIQEECTLSYTPISELKTPEYIKLDENGVPINYSAKYNLKATAYTGDPATASKRPPMPGHIAVDPNEFPYGTEMYIVSADGKYIYGYCVAADTGGFVQMKNTDIDVYLNSEEECYEWGNRDVIVYVF